MPLSRIINPLNLTKLTLSSFSLVTGLTELSPCYGTEPFPTDIWGEISNHLPYHDKVTLSVTCKNQLGLLRNREAAIKRQFEELPKNSELFKAYQNLPESCKTPKIFLRLTEQAELICCFLGLDNKLYPFIEFFSAKGDWRAIWMKIKGLDRGSYGYERDHDVAKALTEEYITKGVWQAIARKIRGLDNGFYEYERDPNAAIRFIFRYLNFPI